jgi:hypothetical protein
MSTEARVEELPLVDLDPVLDEVDNAQQDRLTLRLRLARCQRTEMRRKRFLSYE